MRGHLTLYVVSLLLMTQCSSPPKPRPRRTVAAPAVVEGTHRIWQAALDAAMKYPVHDYSMDDGYIESDWIYQSKRRRYRFFIYVLDSQSHVYDIAIQSQQRKGTENRWQWKMPTLDIEQNLRKAIHAEYKKHPTS